MKDCIFCRSSGPFTTIEHVVPESLGNTKLVLSGAVCDGCQRYFGSEVERFVLDKTIFGLARVFASVPTKKGKAPRVDTRLPPGGALPTQSSLQSELLMSLDQTGMVRAEVIGENDPEFRDGVLKLNWTFSPLVVFRLTQFTLKVGLEYLAWRNIDRVLQKDFDQARRLAREGPHSKWPLFFKLTSRKPSEAERVMRLTTEPGLGKVVWFTFEYVGFALRLNLAGPEEVGCPQGYERISRTK